MDVGHVLASAAGKAATLVPAPDLDPLCFGGVTLDMLLVEAGAVGRVERQGDVRIAGKPAGHLRRDRTDALDGGVAVAVAVEEAIEVGVHDHRGPGAAVNGCGSGFGDAVVLAGASEVPWSSGLAPEVLGSVGVELGSVRVDGCLRPCSRQIWSRASAHRVSKRS